MKIIELATYGLATCGAQGGLQVETGRDARRKFAKRPIKDT